MTRRVRAHNAATDSENRIHSDELARRYGFRGGLVPGVTVYGYMVPLAAAWKSARLKLLKPVFDGEQLSIWSDGCTVFAERGPDDTCAVLEMLDAALECGAIAAQPAPDVRPPVNTAVAGTVLGTVEKKLAPTPAAENVPAALLELANQAVMRNYTVGPWLHTCSEITNHTEAHWGDEVEARSRIHERFEKKGRQFVTLDVLLLAGGRPVQFIRHTAMYGLQPV